MQNDNDNANANANANANESSNQVATVARAPEALLTAIQKLDGTNFLPWKRQILIVLKLRKLDEALTSDDVSEDVDMRAILVLLESMNAAHKIQVQAEPTAKAIMASLERQYANASAANKLRMLVKYLKYEKVSSDTINQHYGKMKEMRATLANLNEKHSEDFFQVILINSLADPEYSDLLAQWELIHPSMKSTEFLVTCLQQREETKTKQNDEPRILVTRSKEWAQMTIEERKKVSKCKACGRKGHWSGDAECSAKRAEGCNKSHTKANIISMNLGAIDEELKEKWILDSGATQHMCNNKRWFAKLAQLTTPRSASVGNGDTIEVLGEGKVNAVADVNGTKVDLSLGDVSYIPELATNLISVGAAAKHGIMTKFDGDKCRMMFDDQVVVEGKLNDSALYVLNLELPGVVEASLLTRNKRPINEWHRVLGHPSKEKMTTLIKEQCIEATGELEPCAECPAGKARHTSHPTSTRPLASEVGQRVHIDLGFLPNKLSYDYYLLCKDEYSSFCFIYHLEKKSETHLALKQFINDFELGSGKTIRCIVSDNGSEIKNKKNELMFAKEGIVHELSAPYVPQQNGRIEREMQSVNHVATTLLCQAPQCGDLKKEALTTACFLRNRVPRLKSRVTPYEAFIGRKPDLSNLVEFGTKCQIIDDGHPMPKLEPKTQNGYVVGFTSRRNTYKVYVPNLRRTIVTCDVIFGPHYTPKAEETRRQQEEAAEVQVSTGSVRVSTDPIPPESEIDMLPRCSTSESFDWYNPERYQTAAEFQTSTVRRRVGKNGKEYLEPVEIEEFFEQFRQDNELEESIRSTGAQLTVSDSENPGNDSRCESPDETSNGEEVPDPPPRSTSRAMFVSLGLGEPSSFEQATSGPNKEMWIEAIQDELDAHRKNNTWQVVDRPKDGVKLTTKWVFTIKRDADGNVERFKARLVARGFEQRRGIDYGELFAPVARTDSIRLALAIAAANDLDIIQFDVSTAFLHGEVEEALFVDPPEGIKIETNKCLKLTKALYGLRQAPRVWHSRLNQALVRLGLRPTESEQCLYVNKASTLYLIIYVDDGLIIGDETECLRLLDELKQQFRIKQLSGDKFVGLEIKRVENGIIVSQRQYTLDIVKRFQMERATPATSPAIDLNKLEEASTESTTAPYRQAVGTLSYLASSSRPDILFMTNLLATFNQNPKDVHWQAVKHIIRYLLNTTDYCLFYERGNRSFKAYCDADWGSKWSNRYSTSGVLLTFAGGPVVYSSRRQTCIALSSTEAEYIAANDAAREIKWISQALSELRVDYEKPTLFVDNLGAISQIKNENVTRKCRHMDLKYKFVKHQFTNRLFKVEHIASSSQPADILTKPLSGPYLRELLKRTKVTVEIKNMAKVKSKLKWISLVFMSILTLASVHGWSFQRVEPIIWSPTRHYVDQGASLYSIEYKHVNPCEYFYRALKQRQGESRLVQEGPMLVRKPSITNTSLNRFHTICQEEVKESWLKEFGKLTSCRSEATSATPSRRFKRFVWFIIGLVVMVVVAAIVATTVTTNSRIDAVNATLIDTRAQLQAAREGIAIQEQINNRTAAALENITNTSRKLALDIGDFAQNMPDMAWMGSKIYYDIAESVKVMKRLTLACKKGIVDTDALAEFANDTELANLRSETTSITSINKSQNGTGLELQFIAPTIASTTHVYRVQAFSVWSNLTRDPKALEYVGPSYLIHNYTANCTKGINDPETDAVFETCIEPNYTDPRLQLWQEARSELSELPTVKKTKSFSYIQCIFNKIVVGNVSYQCPPHVFRLPILQMFDTGNITHRVEMLQLNVSAEVVPPRSKHLNQSVVEEDFNDQIQLIKSVRQLNLKLGETIKKGSIYGIWQSAEELAVNVISIAAAMVTLGWCFINLCCRRSTASQAEYISIVNSQPGSGPAPSCPLPQPPTELNRLYPPVYSRYSDIRAYDTPR